MSNIHGIGPDTDGGPNPDYKGNGAQPTSELPPPDKVWGKRAIEYREVTYGIMKRVRKLNEEDREMAMLILLIDSLFYVDTGEKVFRSLSDIDNVPAKMTNLLIRHAGECMKINMPEDVPNG